MYPETEYVKQHNHMRHMENKPISVTRVLHNVKTVCTSVTNVDNFMPQTSRMYEKRCTGINHMTKNHTSVSKITIGGTDTHTTKNQKALINYEAYTALHKAELSYIALLHNKEKSHTRLSL